MMIRRGTKTRSDSDSPDLMNHATDASDTTSILEDGATSPTASFTSHSKSGHSKHDGDSRREAKTVKVALPGAKKVQPAAKKKKCTPDLVFKAINKI